MISWMFLFRKVKLGQSRFTRGTRGGRELPKSRQHHSQLHNSPPIGSWLSAPILWRSVGRRKEGKKEEDDADDDAVEKRSAQGNAPYHPSIRPSIPSERRRRSPPPHVLRENHEAAERPMIPHNTPIAASEIGLTAQEVITSISRRNENIPIHLLLLLPSSMVVCLLRPLFLSGSPFLFLWERQ